jgi:hypothetical protein
MDFEKNIKPLILNNMKNIDLKEYKHGLNDINYKLDTEYNKALEDILNKLEKTSQFLKSIDNIKLF